MMETHKALSSSRFFRRWPVCASLLFGLALSGQWLAGCSKNAGPGSEPAAAAPRPAHPAMLVPPAATATASTAASLPHGHPPVGNRAASGRGADVSAEELEQRLAELGLAVKFPAGWRLERGSGMRLATVRLPGAEGDAEDGEMSIIPARGSLEDNVRRWEGQFKEKPSAELSERGGDGGIGVTTVEIAGTFSPGGGPMMAAGPPQPGTRLLGAIVQLGNRQEMIFFKAWGPEATMAKWRESFESFVASIRPSR